MKPSRGKAICLPLGSRDDYLKIVNSPSAFRTILCHLQKQHPELFPDGFENGFSFHDIRWSVKLDIPLRRIKLASIGKVFQIRPSFIMPYRTSLTEEIEKALYLRRYGVLFKALSYVFA